MEMRSEGAFNSSTARQAWKPVILGERRFEFKASLVYNVSAPQKAIRFGDNTQNSRVSGLSNYMTRGVDKDESVRRNRGKMGVKT